MTKKNIRMWYCMAKWKIWNVYKLQFQHYFAVAIILHYLSSQGFSHKWNDFSDEINTNFDDDGFVCIKTPVILCEKYSDNFVNVRHSFNLKFIKRLTPPFHSFHGEFHVIWKMTNLLILHNFLFINEEWKTAICMSLARVWHMFVIDLLSLYYVIIRQHSHLNNLFLDFFFAKR